MDNKANNSYKKVIKTIANYYLENNEHTEHLVNLFFENNQFCPRCKSFLPKHLFPKGHHYCSQCRKLYFIERKNIKFICICGKETNKASYYKHLKTKYHIHAENNINHS